MDGENKEKTERENGLLAEMVIAAKKKPNAKGGLVVDPKGSEGAAFSAEIEEQLIETERQVRNVAELNANAEESRSWEKARQVVAGFKPVPFFIWRIANFVLGKPGHINEISEGMLFGLRRLLFAVASDELLGKGEKVNNVREALRIVPSDVVAASSVIHSLCRKLANQQFERIWRPILDDALLRARIGYMVGKHRKEFGAGRGMLAGFAGRVGIVILIATGELEQARQALELLATGMSIKKVGLTIYGCDPLQVSAYVLSAAGCGRDAALGVAGFSMSDFIDRLGDSPEQLTWIAAFVICEQVRLMKVEEIDKRLWENMLIQSQEQQIQLVGEVKKLLRRGHGWGWFVAS